jgi:hypothetical protein
MTKQKNDVTEIRQRFDVLHKKLKHAEVELSRLNLAKIDLQKTCERLDLEVGTGRTRVGKLVEAKDRLEKLTDERNRASESYQTARDQFELFKTEVSGDLFNAAVSMYEEILPEHQAIVKRVSQWREHVSFLTQHYIGRKTIKLIGFRPGQGGTLPQSIFSEEDDIARDTLIRFVAGTLEPEITSIDDSTGNVNLPKKKRQMTA